MRTLLRQKRKSLTKPKQYIASLKVLNNLLKNNILSKKNIAIYSDFGGEINTTKIINFLQNQGCNIYLPVIFKDKLKFSKIGESSKRNKFNIFEPQKTKIINANQLNLIILPLVGFDKNCHRIGMGCGFYDKTLAFRLRQEHYKYPKFFGISHHFQEIKITPNVWDIKMDKIITDKNIFKS